MLANMVLSNDAEDTWLDGSLAEFLIEHKIKPVHSLNSSDDSKPWMWKTRALLRSHISMPSSSTDVIVAL